ncbi:unnamed protein product, partial [Ectocarpus sp. 12 AP-2014]
MQPSAEHLLWFSRRRRATDGGGQISGLRQRIIRANHSTPSLVVYNLRNEERQPSTFALLSGHSLVSAPP